MNHFEIQLSARGIEELHLFNCEVQQLLLHQIAQCRIIQGQPLFTGLLAAFCTGKQHHLACAAINHAAEKFTATDGPVHGPGCEPEFRLDFIQQCQRLPARPVHLVDEGKDRDVPHPAHLEQLSGLGLEPFGGVLQHHCVVCCSEGAIGVF